MAGNALFGIDYFTDKRTYTAEGIVAISEMLKVNRTLLTIECVADLNSSPLVLPAICYPFFLRHASKLLFVLAAESFQQPVATGMAVSGSALLRAQKQLLTL